MASLTEKTTALGYVNAMHLLRRTTYKPSKALANTFASLTPAQALDQLFTFNAPAIQKPINKDTSATYFPDFANPTVVYDSAVDNQYQTDTINFWMYNAVKDSSIQWKLNMFLHSIYIIDYSTVSMTYDYINLLQLYTNKSLKELAYKMTLNQRMLYYLSNNTNTKTAPNQNYAREFLELFTIMKGPQIAAGNYTNYTELDVQQAAKVLTGFRATNGLDLRMNYLDKGMTANSAGHIPNPTNAGWTYATTNIPTGYCVLSQHDITNKTFSAAFGGTTINGSNALTGTYTVYDELQAFINMIFGQTETAMNYARRIYRFFVKSEISLEAEADIISPLALNLLSVQGGVTYNLEAAVKLLLKSKHFYDEEDTIAKDQNFGGKVKSPLDLMLNFMNESSFGIVSPILNPSHFFVYFNVLRGYCWNSGFQFFDSVNVSGYPGYSDSPNFDKNWVTIATLNQRYQSGWVEWIINGYNFNGFYSKLDVPEFIRTSGNFTNPANATILLSELFDIFFVSNPQGLRYGYFENALLNGLSAANWATTWNTWIADLTNVTKKNAVKIATERLLKAMLKSVEYQVM
jgi:uncharacterized protein (DUF1800 family)